MRSFHKFDDPNDPAMQAVNEAGGGESEGFELAERELIEHASHGDEHGTAKITQDADTTDEEQAPDPDQFGAGDSESPEDL